MTSIIHNLTRSAGRLLLTFGLTAAVTSLASCAKDDGATDLGDNPATTLSVANLPGFSDAATRADAAAIGTPDIGKTTWAEEDTLALEIEFYADPVDHQRLGVSRAYATYKSGTWVLGNGLTTITDNKDLPLAVADGKVIWPTRAKAMFVWAYYIPGQTFNVNGIICNTRPAEAGQWEEWSSSSGLITTPGAPIVLDKWTANYARVRVAAAPGDVVKFAAPDFYPTGSYSGSSLGTPVGTDNKRPGEPVGYLTATADDKGNAYFYGTSQGLAKTSVMVSLVHSALYGDTETPVFQNEIHFSITPEGKSYAINALDR